MRMELGSLRGKKMLFGIGHPEMTAEEVARLEALADATGIDTRGGWEHTME